jgi:selenocysteine-specific elongation factor
MDPDRLAEEKDRGLTIELGFAWTKLETGDTVAFVDVPGHARFIKNMLAGVGAVTACLFVVAATEGWKAQSEEHLRVLELVGMAHGVIALTKADLVDQHQRNTVRSELERSVRGTFLERAETVEVDAVAGLGLDDLSEALARLSRLEGAPNCGRPRLWVDRAFVATGSGTVVTGTLLGGALERGDPLVVVPGDQAVRIRALESMRLSRVRVEPGERVAVNLAGLSHTRIKRGDALVVPRQWRPTTAVDASLQVLSSLKHPVSAKGSYAVYIGSSEQRVDLRMLGALSVPPGGSGLVRLLLPVALPLLPGDRYVLREDGRSETVGGGEILDVEPVLPPHLARPPRSIDEVVTQRGWITVDHLESITGERVSPTIGKWVASSAAFAAEVASVRGLLADGGVLGVDVATLDERQREILKGLDNVSVVGARARMQDRADATVREPVLERLELAGFRPYDRLKGAELRILLSQGQVVKCGTIWFAASAIEQAKQVVAGLLEAHPDGFTMAEARVALETTRKFAVPLLEWMDTQGLTVRRGDRRVRGPRLGPFSE